MDKPFVITPDMGEKSKASKPGNPTLQFELNELRRSRLRDYLCEGILGFRGTLAVEFHLQDKVVSGSATLYVSSLKGCRSAD